MPDRISASRATEKGQSSRLRGEAENLAEQLPPLLAEAERVASTVSQGVHGRRRIGAGESFWQFRRYQQGDTLGSIDWRRSGRSDHLFVRENEWEAAETVWIWPDLSPSMDYRSDTKGPTKQDRCLVLSLALVSLLIRGGEHVALLGQASPPTSGRAGFHRLAHLLLDPANATTSSGQDESLPPAEPLPKYAQMVVLSDFLAPPDKMIARLRHYADRGIKGHLLQILDPAEEDLPFEGRTEFAGIEEDTRLTIGRAESLRTAYQDRLNERQAQLRKAARDFGWTFAVHRTDRLAQGALLSLYGALSGAGGVNAAPRAGL